MGVINVGVIVRVACTGAMAAAAMKSQIRPVVGGAGGMPSMVCSMPWCLYIRFRVITSRQQTNNDAERFKTQMCKWCDVC